jgi:hypothetical protein
MREMAEGAPKPTAEEIEAFYRANRENFRLPEMFHAAHIVKHVNEEQTEEQAEAGIQAALADLERGVPFAEAADRHSDCKGNGGDLGQFPPGHMVEEFEAAISALQPGERTGIFTTPFGSTSRSCARRSRGVRRASRKFGRISNRPSPCATSKSYTCAPSRSCVPKPISGMLRMPTARLPDAARFAPALLRSQQAPLGATRNLHPRFLPAAPRDHRLAGRHGSPGGRPLPCGQRIP